MLRSLMLPFRLLLWPLAGRRRAAVLLTLLLGGLGWWRYQDAVLRFLGLGRPPERSVELRLRPPAPSVADPATRARLEARYGPLTPLARAEALSELRGRFGEARDAAFAVVRARGDGRRTTFARTGEVPVAPGTDPTLLTRVVLDPVEASGSDPVALTLVLEREEWPEVYALRAELDWLAARVEADPAAPPPPAPLEADGR